ncbi:YmaF family protein [Clostridium tetani]|uniref:YmaF family protein n=1 Tax=Clostridium tetani TaxID=1513 RepID=UPI00100A6A63|nr:YmaF family protein [Clostridium tetani]RXM57327.1 hypothetical protein DP133_09445 [Clostridium tetani]RXM77154.1 hypothetical protein DP154_06365 [Clostridium tetani]RYU99398.1 hypothetical protein DP144_06375 [Clostridium tetani]
MSQHSHSYSGTTTYNDGHIHHYGGVTDKALSGVPHTHCIKGVTTFNDCHEHSYVTRTGPAINLACGCHYHYFETKVKFVDGHIHCISGCTSAD